MLSDSCVETYWDGFAGGYAHLGPPLTPGPEDAALILAAITQWAALHPGRAPRAVLLGVTPGIAQLPLPPGSWLTGVDHSAIMTRSVWPGNVPKRRSVLRGNWLALPLRDSSCDLALGDGSMNSIKYADFRTLAAEVRRVLRPGGLFILRSFTRPRIKEDPDAVFAELPRHASFHHFKLRLMMALQPSVEHGTAVHDAYRYWSRGNVDKAGLAAQTGWSRESIEMIELYRGPNTSHTYPTLAELQSVLCEFFRDITISIPSYSLGQFCPTLVLRP